jgi:LuxR family maltose regulon positive regulatory protein
LSASHEVVLAEAKLAPPRMRSQTIERPRVTRALDAGAPALTLVAAPAGYGKTTAVRAWCAHRKVPVAWVTLDASDNDPARLWRYVITAVDRVHRGLARAALARLDVPGASIESAIDELMNSVAGLGQDLVIVLDDLHRVTDSGCLASIDYGLEDLPSNARAVLLTRVDPALRLARLRAGGALTEVRTTELGFTVHETRELVVGRGGVPLEPGEVEMLHRRTDGWPAALVLAALWLRQVDDVPRGVREFGGDHRFVVDYLSNEVLELLPANSRSFLLQASVLGQFTAELCDGVLERSDSAAVLSELERLNLFVHALERGGWFRLHSMFAEFGRARLTSLEPDAAAEIHRRAAHWLHARGLPIEAVKHAAATSDHATVAEILSEHRQLLIQGGAPPNFAELGACTARAPAPGSSRAGRLRGHRRANARRAHDRATPTAWVGGPRTG